MFLRILFSLFFSWQCFVNSALAEEKLRLDYDCHGNALEACYLIVEGEIDSDAAERLEAMLADGIESFQVLLNSKGGDLAAGLAMGRVIRKYDMQTRIGVYQKQDLPLPGECHSACAYAFLGGTQRLIREGSRIGFHQFLVGSSAFLEGKGGLIVGQKLSASVIAYMVEMGIDARLFTVASETAFVEMYFPSQPERLEYGVETAVGFDHFSMEPYKDGVIASSKRLGQSDPYDRVDQLTAYCRNGRAHVLLTINGENPFVPDPAYATTTISVSYLEQSSWDNRVDINVDYTEVRTWSGPNGAYIEIKFDARELPLTDNTKQFQVALRTSRAAGGYYGASLALNQMDRNMLRTAFRLCI